MAHMSINSIFVLHIYWMIPRKVDLVEANAYKILFYLSFDPSAEDDTAEMLSSFGEMKEISKIRFPPSPTAPFRSICLHPNQCPSTADLHAYCLFFSCTLHLHACVDCENGVSS